MKTIRCLCLTLCVLFSALPVHAAQKEIQRIVSLAPNLTELTFAAGAGERLIGTVEFSDEPAAAKQIPRIGDAFRVDAERILALQPDLVLAWDSGTPKPTIERLRALQLNVSVFETQRIADVPRVVRELGELVGTQKIANEAAARFDSDMAALRAQYRGRRTVTVFLQVNSHPLFTVNGQQIMSELVTICGGRNVFEDLNQLAPQIGIEAVIARNPQVIISTDDAEPAAVDEWRKWSQVTAVRTNNLFKLPANDMTRATIRLTQGAAALCRTLDTARARL